MSGSSNAFEIADRNLSLRHQAETNRLLARQVNNNQALASIAEQNTKLMNENQNLALALEAEEQAGVINAMDREAGLNALFASNEVINWLIQEFSKNMFRDDPVKKSAFEAELKNRANTYRTDLFNTLQRWEVASGYLPTIAREHEGCIFKNPGNPINKYAVSSWYIPGRESEWKPVSKETYAHLV